ncbi:MAG TPA: Tex-like N-terminal domain-containing protein [Planctomycetota bacterium]|nr:Tex-like N-terminal domain-containing protein [Planctomycetota bacterium]
MTAQLTLKTLAKEFSIKEEEVQAVLEMMDAGLLAPFIARVRRARTGALTENQLRRLCQRREELDELDRRRGTILRQLEKVEGIAPSVLAHIETCPDRFELEDLYVPNRRPEPEVQLAIDRGLTPLADLLIKPIPKADRVGSSEEGEDSNDENHDETQDDESNEQASEESSNDSSNNSSNDHSEDSGEAEGSLSDQDLEDTLEAQNAEVNEGAPAQEAEASAPATSEAPDLSVDPSPVGQVDITAALSELCLPFVNPDRGIHTEEEALLGAVRILSDRLGRNASLRTSLRRMLRKHGVIQVQAAVPVEKMGRHKALAKFRAPLKQVQGHRLIALRQAQRERVLAVHLAMDPKQAIAKVRGALGRFTHPAYEELLSEVARRAYAARLLPVIEADVRLELKERSDAEALRFLCNHLRQLMFTPTYGRRPVVGVDVSAKGDWVLALVGEDGTPLKTARIEVGEKDDATLLGELTAFLEGTEVQIMATGHDKRARTGAVRLRQILKDSELDVVVSLVNEAGLGSYANSEFARAELPDQPVPERHAISIGRRLQDPMAEFLKVDPRHLGLGAEQGLVSKANLARAFTETTESSVALIGCDLNFAPKSVLLHVPGLDAEAVDKILAARAQAPIASREALRADGILSEVQWTNAVGFLRVGNSATLLDHSFLHPELYALATELLQSAGGGVEESLGRPGATKGLRRETHGLDEHTWRDLMRELSRPGRDPRSFLMRPRLLAPDTDPARLTQGRVVEGIVTAVASFGAFIDLGLAKDAIVHISQISSRYIRDARELLSIGQVVRARITDPSAQRLTLSLKDVPAQERVSSGAPRRRGRGEGRGRGRGREREARDPREGLRAGDARGMRLGGSKVRRGGDKRGRGEGDRFDKGERVDLSKINSQAKSASSSPFADFFSKKPGTGDKGKA